MKTRACSYFTLRFFPVLFCILFLIGCQKEEGQDVKPAVDTYLSSSKLHTEISKDSVVGITKVINPALGGMVKTGVKVYDIVYKTKNVDGKEVLASGIIIVPQTDQEVSMVSVQHGTTLAEKDAPSVFGAYTEASIFGPLYGSYGYITVFPDYLGYGTAKNIPHPYEHKSSLASSTLDMLRAAKEFLKKEKSVKWNEKLYITGYSEGGFATMSLQKKIEEEASGEFNLRASSCGAGAYDKTAFMKFIINEKTAGVPEANVYYLWVLLTYDKLYNLNRPASYYFKEPYAGEIAKKGIGYPIQTSFDQILNDSFKKALNDGSDKEFVKAIADNDVYNWKPKVPTRLFHGDADPVVFYFNSEHAEKAMKALGAPDVKLVTIKGGDHATSVADYLLGTLTFFAETK